MTLTIEYKLAQFLESLDQAASLPEAIRFAVSQQTMEIVAAWFAGATIPDMQPVLRIHSRSAAKISIPATGMRSELSLAAAAAAALSHAPEFDPIHAATVICPAAVTIAPTLVLAQEVPMSGSRYIAAICAGYEVAVRVGHLLNGPDLLLRGWWPTAVCGTLAAATAAAVGMGLSGEQLMHAIGLAAVHTGGLAPGGPPAAVARSLLCAHTARVGVDAAVAAASGVTAPSEIFSGSRNLLTALSIAAAPDTLVEDLGETWAILETSLKRWPCALQAQSALDALSRATAGISRSETIDVVEFALPRAMQRVIDRPGAPSTRWGAVGSLQFLAAAWLLDGDLLESRLESGRLDPRILELMQRVHVTADPELDSRYPVEWPARVTIRTSNQELTALTLLPPGHPLRPLPIASSVSRFRQHASGHLTEDRISAALEIIEYLDVQEDLGPLLSLLNPPEDPHRMRHEPLPT